MAKPHLALTTMPIAKAPAMNFIVFFHFFLTPLLSALDACLHFFFKDWVGKNTHFVLLIADAVEQPEFSFHHPPMTISLPRTEETKQF